MAPGLCLASAAEATLLLALLPLHTWKVATSFTTSFPFYAHCSFLFGQSDHPFYEEPLGLWQMSLGHHHIHSAHLLHLDSGSRGLHAHNRELHQVCLYSFSLLLCLRLPPKFRKCAIPNSGAAGMTGQFTLAGATIKIWERGFSGPLTQGLVLWR